MHRQVIILLGKAMCLCVLLLGAVPSFADDAPDSSPPAAIPEPVSPPAPPEAAPIASPVPPQKRQDIVVRQLSSMEFGTFASEQGGGSITITPHNTRLTSGNIAVLNTGGTGAAEFEIIGAPGEMVTIFLPESVNLDNSGGRGHAVITSLVSIPADSVTLDTAGRARVKVGGTLQISGGVSPGSYNGLFDIDVRYLR